MSWKDILKTMCEEHQKGALGDRWSSMKRHYILMSRDKPIIEFLQDIDDEKPPFDALL